MNNYLSNKFRIISFFSILLVILLHSYSIPGDFSMDNLSFNGGYNFFIQYFLSQGIARIAVPIFFCISGYLFFLNFDGSKTEFIDKFKKRIKSVVLPYLFWSAWGLLFFYLLQLFPFSKSYFTNNIADYTFLKILYILFINPIPYQLWFLRDLIVLVVLSPVTYWTIKYFRAWPLLIFCVLWFNIFKFSLVIVSIESVLFFCCGAYLSIHESIFLEKKLFRKEYLIITLMWILITLVKTVFAYANFNYITILMLHKFSILLGMLSVWSLYDFFMQNRANTNNLIYDMSFFSFFLYVFHEPILTILKRVMIFFTGSEEIISLAIYFVNPLLVIFFGICVAYLLKKHIPGFYAIITGGR